MGAVQISFIIIIMFAVLQETELVTHPWEGKQCLQGGGLGHIKPLLSTDRLALGACCRGAYALIPLCQLLQLVLLLQAIQALAVQPID